MVRNIEELSLVRNIEEQSIVCIFVVAPSTEWYYWKTIYSERFALSANRSLL